jgi:hypothetical protein
MKHHNILHKTICEDKGLLGCDALSFGDWFLMFRMHHILSNVRNYIYPMTEHHIPEDPYLQQHHCKNKSHKAIFAFLFILYAFTLVGIKTPQILYTR